LTDLARKGHPYAQMNLAAIVMRTKQDGGKAAVQLYELAGRGGLDQAWTELGRMYRAGLGVAQDHDKAMEYFRKGAQSGNPQCNFMLGVYYSTPQGETAADQAAAFKHFQKAAIRGKCFCFIISLQMFALAHPTS
jgi:TPR repeat protein